MRHPKLVSALAVSSLGLLAVLSLERKPRTPADDARILDDFSASSIEKMTFETPEERTIWLRSNPDDPEAYRTERNARLDPARVGSLLRALEDARFLRPASVSAKAGAALVLEGRAGRVRVETYEAPPDLPLGRLVCVESNAPRRCGVVLGALVERLLESPRSYLALELLPWRPTEVTSIERSGPRPRRLVADALGFRDDTSRRISTEETQRFLRSLVELRLRATTLGPQDAAPEPSRSSLVLRLARGEETLSLTLTEGCEGNSASTRVTFASDDAFCADGELFGRTLALGERVDPRLSPLSEDEIDHFRVEGPAGVLEVVREGARFRALGASSLELDGATAKPLFAALASVEGELVSPPASVEVTAKWTIFGVAPRSNEPVKLSFGAALRGDRILVRRDDDGSWLSVEATPLLLGSPSVLRALIVHALPRERLESLLRRDGQTSSSVPLDGPRSPFEELGRRFSDLRALRWLPGKPSTLPRFSLEGRFAGDGEPVVLRFFDPVLGGVVATSSRVDGAFVVARDDFEALDVDEWTGRPLLSPPSPESKLEIAVGGENAVFLRKGDVWETAIPQTFSEPNEVALAALELSALRRAPNGERRRAAVVTLELQDPRARTTERVVIESCDFSGSRACAARLSEGLVVEVPSAAVANLLRHF